MEDRCLRKMDGAGEKFWHQAISSAFRKKVLYCILRAEIDSWKKWNIYDSCSSFRL